MIKISASTVAPDSVIEQGVSDIERDIIERMAASNAVYDFDSLDQLTFEMKMRMNIIAAAKALYNSGTVYIYLHKNATHTTGNSYRDRSSAGRIQITEGCETLQCYY